MVFGHAVLPPQAGLCCSAKGGQAASTKALFEAGSNLRPRALVSGVRFEIGHAGVEKGDYS
jgi:hypothetical protein